MAETIAPTKDNKPTPPSAPLTSQTALPILKELGVAQQGGTPVADLPDRFMSTVDNIHDTYRRLAQLSPLNGVTEAMGSWATMAIRRLLSAPADRSLIIDGMSQAAALPFMAYDFVTGKPGDQGLAARVEDRLMRHLEKTARPPEHGQFDIVMAAGWKVQGPIKINGVMRNSDKPIEINNMLAVFVRDGKTGEIEILDPSIKVEGLTELYRLPDAMSTPEQRQTAARDFPFSDAYKKMLQTETPADARWREIAGTYVDWQVMPMVASLGGVAAMKGAQAFPKGAKVAEIAAKIETTSKAVAATTGPLGLANGATSVVGMGGQFSQSLYFTPEAIRKITDGVANILLTKDGLAPESVRKNLNTALHDKSFKESSNAQQIYIPSLRENEDPYVRLKGLMQGRLPAYEKTNNPWQPWPQDMKSIEVGEIREALNQDVRIQRAFMGAVEKHLSGKELSNEEVLVIRIGLNTGKSANSLTSQSNPDTFVYSREERTETLRRLNDEINRRVASGLDNKDTGATLAKKIGIDLKAYLETDDGAPQFTPAQIKTFVSEEIKSLDKAIAEQEAAKVKNPVIQNRVNSPFTLG